MTATERHHIASALKDAILWRAWTDEKRLGALFDGELPVREILGTERHLAEAACGAYTALTHRHPMVRYRALLRAERAAGRVASDPLILEALEAAREAVGELVAVAS